LSKRKEICGLRHCVLRRQGSGARFGRGSHYLFASKRGGVFCTTVKRSWVTIRTRP